MAAVVQGQGAMRKRWDIYGDGGGETRQRTPAGRDQRPGVSVRLLRPEADQPSRPHRRRPGLWVLRARASAHHGFSSN